MLYDRFSSDFTNFSWRILQLNQRSIKTNASALPIEEETEEVGITLLGQDSRCHHDHKLTLKGVKVNDKFANSLSLRTRFRPKSFRVRVPLNFLWQKADHCDVYKRSVWQRDEPMKSEASTWNVSQGGLHIWRQRERVEGHATYHIWQTVCIFLPTKNECPWPRNKKNMNV